MSPMPPSDVGEFAMMRTALHRLPYSSTSSLSSVWIAAECPRPPNSSIATARLSASSRESRLEQGEHRRQLLAGERLVRADPAGGLGQQDGRVLGDGEAGLFGDPDRGLADDTGVELGVRAVLRVRPGPEDELLELRLLLCGAHVGVQPLELAQRFVVDGGVDDRRLLRGAHHAVVEVLAQNDVGHRAGQLRARLDVGRDVARADAQRRLPARIRRPDHRVAAGRQDERHTGVVHQLPGALDRRLRHPLDAVLRRTRGDSGVAHDLGGLHGAVLRVRVERENDRAARLQRDERLEDRRRRRVRHRGETGDDSDRFGDLDDPEQIVAGDDADGLRVAHPVGHVLAGEDVLGRLVLEDTTAGLGHGGEGELAVLVEGGDRCLLHDVVDGGLVEVLVVEQCLLGLADENVDLADTYGLVRGSFHVPTPSSGERRRPGLPTADTAQGIPCGTGLPGGDWRITSVWGWGQAWRGDLGGWAAGDGGDATDHGSGGPREDPAVDGRLGTMSEPGIVSQ